VVVSPLKGYAYPLSYDGMISNKGKSPWRSIIPCRGIIIKYISFFCVILCAARDKKGLYCFYPFAAFHFEKPTRDKGCEGIKAVKAFFIPCCAYCFYPFAAFIPCWLFIIINLGRDKGFATTLPRRGIIINLESFFCEEGTINLGEHVRCVSSFYGFINRGSYEITCGIPLKARSFANSNKIRSNLLRKTFPLT